jgi:hypothetical protein
MDAEKKKEIQQIQRLRIQIYLNDFFRKNLIHSRIDLFLYLIDLSAENLRN